MLNLKKYRKEANLAQQELSDATGIGRSALVRYEKEKMRMGQIDGADFIVRLIAMSSRIHGFTVVDIDGIYNVYINQDLSYSAQVAAFNHEVGHIIRDDFFNRTDIRAVEA